jgi:thioredoxin 1
MTGTDAVRRLTGGDELAELIGSERRVLAEFYSRSCPKCDAQEPILGLVAREFDGVVAMVDPGGELSLLREYGVASTPGFVRFEGGEPTGTLADGVVGAERLLSFARGEAT